MQLHCFTDGTRADHALPDDLDAAAAHLARHFAMDATTIAVALRTTA